MAIWNLGSINIDHVYQLPHMPTPGETLASLSYRKGLGGKGANQSVAAARAGANVHHLGAIGQGDTTALSQLADYGVNVAHVSQTTEATGHAIIHVDAFGENMIVIHPGANIRQRPEAIAAALKSAARGDLLLLQNETSHQAEAARVARQAGMRVIYSAAPFDLKAVEAVVPFTDILCVNELEAAQLAAALGPDLPVADVIVTRGAAGAEWRGKSDIRAFPVSPVDTTGAGDCFTGNIAAALDAGLSPPQAMRRAAAAGAIQVTRHGACEAMPSAAEVDAFLEEHA